MSSIPMPRRVSDPSSDISSTSSGFIPQLTPIVQQPIWDLYENIKELGRGALSERVVLGKRRSDNALRALKIFKKGSGPEKMMEVKHEKEILRLSKHMNIVTVHEIIEDEKEIILVLEYVEHGNLLTWVRDRDVVTENEVKIIVRQVLGALEYLHCNNIVHRDVKPDNILVRRLEPLEIVLCDFGLAKVCVCEEGLCFSPSGPGIHYMAPRLLEALHKHMNKEEPPMIHATRGDAKSWELWSVGVLTYFLLSGEFPFKGDTTSEKLDCIDRLIFPPRYFGHVSDLGKEFVRSLLCPDGSSRIKSATAARYHKWLTDFMVPPPSSAVVAPSNHSDCSADTTPDTPLSTTGMVRQFSDEQIYANFSQYDAQVPAADVVLPPTIDINVPVLPMAPKPQIALKPAGMMRKKRPERGPPEQMD